MTRDFSPICSPSAAPPNVQSVYNLLSSDRGLPIEPSLFS